MTKLSNIEGIGYTATQTLETVGIDSIECLLENGKTPDGRKNLSIKTGITSKRILNWINRADLARIKGIGEEYADLLEAAGVGTVCLLADDDAETLHKRLVKVNSMKRLVRRVPAVSRVSSWVEQAKDLPQIVQY